MSREGSEWVGCRWEHRTGKSPTQNDWVATMRTRRVPPRQALTFWPIKSVTNGDSFGRLVLCVLYVLQPLHYFY